MVNDRDYLDFVELDDFPGYYINRYGTIYSSYSDGYLATRLSGHGYRYVTMSVNRKKITVAVHRLVAKAYLNDWDSNLTVDHIDGNKLNNYYRNLRMLTRYQNTISGMNNGLYDLVLSKSKPVYDVTDDCFYESIKECSRFLNTSSGNIRMALQHRASSYKGSSKLYERKTVRGHILEYAEKEVIR